MIKDNLNVDISNIIDLINIKNLPEMICEYLHSKNEKSYGNLRKFYSKMFEYFSEDIKNSYLNRILKYLSSDTPSDIYFIDDINDGVFDKELKMFCDNLVEVINKYDDCTNLYEQLNRKINFIFYENTEDDDYHVLKRLNNNSKYNQFIFGLFKHAFKNYKTSLPGIVGKEIYENTKTLTMGGNCYIRSLYAASSIGNDDASIQLYNVITKEDVNLATSFLLKTKENPIVLWIIAYDLEKNRLNKELIQSIKVKYKYIFDISDEFIDSIDITEKTKNIFCEVPMMMAFKMYYYCYKKYNYTKAGNSLGKLLILDYISYKNDRKQSIELAKKYLKAEMRRGNIHAIGNMAIYSYKNPEEKLYSERELKNLLNISSMFGAVWVNYYLGKLLYDEGKYEESIKYLNYAAAENDGNAYILLGNYHELNNDNTKAIECYKKAIANHSYDGAYHLALLYYNNYKENNADSQLYKSLSDEYINKYYNLFSEEIKKKADILLK